MAFTAEYDVGIGDEAAGGRAQAFDPVFADAHDGQPA
jgi:hypothetical protein